MIEVGQIYCVAQNRVGGSLYIVILDANDIWARYQYIHYSNDDMMPHIELGARFTGTIEHLRARVLPKEKVIMDPKTITMIKMAMI